MKKSLNESVPKRKRRATMAALAAELRGLKKEMAALRRLMPPAPYLDLDLEWRGGDNVTS